ncbi:MAG: dephospho-CoA kinase [Chlamydiia bacterium]
MRKTGENVKIKRILVFGPIGAGKSSVLELFKDWGAFTVDCDRITHKILENDLEVQSILKERFGPSVFENGKISRKKLATVAFNSKKNLEDLEKTIVPRVFIEIKRLYEEVKDQNYQAFVVEAPIYPKVETTWKDFFDQKIAVIASKETRTLRAHQKGLTPQELELRSSYQIPLEELGLHADLVLENNYTINELKQQFLKKVTP